MGSTSIFSRYNVADGMGQDDECLHPFTVSATRGFLPLMDPLVTLPDEFEPLESILQRMPIRTASGEPGLLAKGQLGDVVDGELPDLTPQVEAYAHDLRVICALYRDYSFLASGYLLEPAHKQFMDGHGYGMGRPYLPREIVGPFVRCAEIAGFKPFLEFASYVLLNYKLIDPSRGPEFSNLRLIRAFEHGLDPASSESGFILVHLTMVQLSAPLVRGVLEACDVACQAVPLRSTDGERRRLNAALAGLAGAMADLNGLMKTIYEKSKPHEYDRFRTFMFGIASESMFPDGVIYAGYNDDRPTFFRGETGANDAMVPLMDAFLQVPMPDTPLTGILHEFADYRSTQHKTLLSLVSDLSSKWDIKNFALGYEDQAQQAPKSDETADLVRESRAAWLRILNEVRSFRWQHWCLVKEYVLKRSKHPTATGGSPILTYLPNQLEAVLDEMVWLSACAAEDNPRGLGKACDNIMDVVVRQKEMLKKEREKYADVEA